jgi:hypothetical protein
MRVMEQVIKQKKTTYKKVAGYLIDMLKSNEALSFLGSHGEGFDGDSLDESSSPL